MTREEALSKAINIVRYFEAHLAKSKEAREDAVNIIEALEQELCEDMGEVSDGYHTFNQLYHQRAVLFAAIVNQNKDKSWKSFKHSDGNYCFDSNGEWFIVGVDTPKGSYTYHYSKEYWNMFDCEELECGKEWDGHTEEDVTRLLSLEQEPCTDAISRQAVIDLPRIKTHNQWGNVIKESVDIEDVRQLPPVTPAEKVGHWIPPQWDDGMSDPIYYQVRCSECGFDLDPQTFGVELKKYGADRFCPKCGAKMQEVEE